MSLVAFEGGFIFVGSVDEFGEVDRVRLLPDEHRADARWALDAAGVGHLGPLDALGPFEFGHRLAGRHHAVEAVEGAFEDLGMAPERPVRGVPPVHLHVELAEPGVDAEASLLRWELPGVVDGHEVLRENDTALQLGGAGVRVAGEVDDSAGGPVLLPVGARGGFDGGEGVGRIGRCRYGVSDQPIVWQEVGCELDLAGMAG